MKKSFFRILPAVILLVGTVVVLGGCEKKKEPPTPQDIDIIDTTKAVSFKEILPISADTVIIINSDEDLKSYCDKNSSFDFTKGSLLITCGNTTYGVANISVRLTKKDDIHYNCNIDVKMYYTTHPEGWKKCYWASQKIDSKAKIEISINKHH